MISTENLQRLNKPDENGRTPGMFLEQCYQSKSVPGGNGHHVGLFAEIYKSDFGSNVCLHCAASAIGMINRLGYAWENEKHLLSIAHSPEVIAAFPEAVKEWLKEIDKSPNESEPTGTDNAGTITIHLGSRVETEFALPVSPKKGGRPKGSGKK